MKRINDSAFSLIAVALIIAGLSLACSFREGAEKGTAGVEKFHRMYNAGQYREIYQQADERFKQAATEADFLKLMKALNRKLGTFKSVTASGGQVNSGTDGTIATLTYDAEYAEGKATEQFSFSIGGGEARLLRFDINSPAFMK